MEWNVFLVDFNSKKLKLYNVLNHYRFLERIKKEYTNCESKEQFMEQLDEWARYCFCSKCEYEVIVSHWPPLEGTEHKVDIYKQLKANWKHFSEYVWILLENNSL